MPKSLSILIANVTLAGYTGTELVVRDLAFGLKKLGHNPLVYSPQVGGISQQITAAGIKVVTDLALLSEEPDMIQGHHYLETIQAILRFPTTPAIFVCHDSNSWHSKPPVFNAIMAYLAVSSVTQQRLLREGGISLEKTQIIYNWVDTERFKRRSPLPNFPKRALVFSSYMKDDAKLSEIQQACAELNISLDVIGFGVGKGSAYPETVLKNYDLVFAKGKCALEAMAVGCAVVLCDIHGLGGMISTAQLSHFRQRNFGATLLNKAITAAAIKQEIEKFDAKNATEVCDIIRETANLNASLAQYLEVYKTCLDKGKILNPLSDHAQQELFEMRAIVEKSQQSFEMLALSAEEACKLELQCLDAPTIIFHDALFHVNVLLRNLTATKLASFLPKPVYFSYHWVCKQDKQLFIFEGVRSPIQPWLGGQQESSYNISVYAPQVPGLYELVITLVQEEVRWFDQLEKPVAFTIEIEIT